MFSNPNQFANQTAITITVPCGANPSHLHFVRCCCKTAGMGDNVSFVFEPVSAFGLIYYAKLETSLRNANMEDNVAAGNYLVIDIGGGTTDLAYI